VTIASWPARIDIREKASGDFFFCTTTDEFGLPAYKRIDRLAGLASHVPVRQRIYCVAVRHKTSCCGKLLYTLGLFHHWVTAADKLSRKNGYGSCVWVSAGLFRCFYDAYRNERPIRQIEAVWDKIV